MGHPSRSLQPPIILKTYPFSILQYGIETVKYNVLIVFQADDQLRRLLICLDPANSNEGLQFSEFQEKFSVWVESEQRFVLILDIVLTVKFSLNTFAEYRFRTARAGRLIITSHPDNLEE